MVKLSKTVFLFLLLCKVSAGNIVPDACTELSDSLQNCTALLSDNGDSCLECWISSIPQDAKECNDGENDFCAAFASCDCGSCSQVIIDVTECLVDAKGGCYIDCGTTTATLDPKVDTPATNNTIPEACTEQFNSLVSCAAALPDLGQTCLKCWPTSIPQDATDCNDGERKFCAAFTSCYCGSCDSKVVAITDCLVNQRLQELGDAVCQINCGSGGSGMPLASAFALISSIILALTL